VPHHALETTFHQGYFRYSIDFSIDDAPKGVYFLGITNPHDKRGSNQNIR
jgi:hypothetical protein